MNPCIDQMLVGVADRTQVAAISHWSHDPAATSLPMAMARRFPAHFGTAEEVIARRPDLVMLSPHTPLATRAALRRLGIPTLEVGVPGTIAESHAQIRAVARAAGQPARGEAMVAAIDRALAASRWTGPPHPALIRMASGLSPGDGTLAADLMRHAGFANQSRAYGFQLWDMAPVEPLVRRPPGLLLTDRPDALHPVLRRAGVRAAAFPGRLLNCGGPTIAAAVRRLAVVRAGQPA
jgi:iron complex transport system substrate-binding protein